MKIEDGVASHFEFAFPRLDTLLLVEVADAGVTIRATRDTFSPRRKACFVRELVAEGFIPEEFQWFQVEGAHSCHRGVRWLVDVSWLGIDEAMMARTHRGMMKFLGLSFMAAALLVGLVATGHLGNRLPDRAAVHPYSSR
jgi:hypothetical protein